VHQHLDQRGLPDGVGEDPRGEHRAALQDAHEREAPMMEGRTQRRVQVRRDELRGLGNK
jgi:hypothetical protein